MSKLIRVDLAVWWEKAEGLARIGHQGVNGVTLCFGNYCPRRAQGACHGANRGGN